MLSQSSITERTIKSDILDESLILKDWESSLDIKCKLGTSTTSDKESEPKGDKDAGYYKIGVRNKDTNYINQTLVCKSCSYRTVKVCNMKKHLVKHMKRKSTIIPINIDSKPISKTIN